ncbi:hypothetical protein IL306_013950, partial [Fusarium sp. DS 682]
MLLEEAFNFHLSPTYMGVCTTYKENLSYHEGSIGNKTIVYLSMLLSELVDQEKSGFEFDGNIWSRIKKEKCGGKLFLEAPAYKSGNLAILAASSHVIDVLTYFMRERIQKGIKDFSEYRMDSGIGPDKPVLTTFDPDLVRYWDDFEKEAGQVTSLVDPSSCWMKDLQSSL